MKQRVILHCDGNNFFASCECALNKNLIDKPVAVAGNPEKRTGVIIAKNYIAKSFNVNTGDTIYEAKRKCPDIIFIPPHHNEYQKFSKKLQKIYEQYTDKVEAFSIDECWLDVTDTLKFFGTGEEIAYKIKEQVKKEVGITISVGVSFCKLFAKLGSDMKKPDAVTVISRANFKNKIYSLPAKSIIGIGRQTEKKLTKMNILTLGDYVRIPDDILQTKFGVNGIKLKQDLLGFDNDEVKKIDDYTQIKSIGNGTTTLFDIKNIEEMKSVVMFLCDEIATRLRQKNLKSLCINVSLRTNLLNWLSKSKTIKEPTNTEQDIFKESITLIQSFWNSNIPIRAVRISCSSLVDGFQSFQTNLFNNNDKKEKLNKAIDKVREKYGYDAISPLVAKNNDLINIDALRLDDSEKNE